MSSVPRVERGRWIHAGELGGNRFAQHDGPGPLEQGHRSGIVVGHEMLVNLGAGGGGNAGSVVKVLDADGNAMQWARFGATGHFFIPGFSIRQHRHPVQVHPGIEGRFQRVNAVQQGLGQVHRRQFPAADEASGFGNVEFVGLGHCTVSNDSVELTGLSTPG